MRVAGAYHRASSGMCAAKNAQYPPYHRRRVERPAHPLSRQRRHPPDTRPGPGNPVQLACGGSPRQPLPGPLCRKRSPGSRGAVAGRGFGNVHRARSRECGQAPGNGDAACARPRKRRAGGCARLAGRCAAAQDIVFLDPPFDAGILAESMRLLESRGWLAGDAYVYIEMPAGQGPPVLPAGWIAHRSGRAGAVGYHLARRRHEEAST